MMKFISWSRNCFQTELLSFKMTMQCSHSYSNRNKISNMATTILRFKFIAHLWCILEISKMPIFPFHIIKRLERVLAEEFLQKPFKPFMSQIQVAFYQLLMQRCQVILYPTSLDVYLMQVIKTVPKTINNWKSKRLINNSYDFTWMTLKS